MAIQMVKYLFTVDDFYRMGEAGIFRPDDRLELIQGEIVEMVPAGSHDATVVDRIARPLTVVADSVPAIVRVQGPVRLNRRSEVFPDIAVLAQRSYWDGHPQPNDVWLLVEVADSTLLSDQRVKVPLYAESRIPEVCVVNLTNETIEVYTHPAEGGYANVRVAGHSELVSPQALPSALIAVDQLFG
jgi:Uma2 family endonuclease